MFYDNLLLPRFLKFFGLVLLTFLVVGGVAYNLSFSMDVVDTRNINASNLPNRVLIATQGSSFKNELTDSIINVLDDEDFYIKVTDVENLGEEHPFYWTAVIVMHTWEYWKPQEDAAKFLNLHKEKKNLIVVATSGGNDQMIDGIAGWSSASTLTDIPFLTEQIIMKVRYLADKSVQSIEG